MDFRPIIPRFGGLGVRRVAVLAAGLTVACGGPPTAPGPTLSCPTGIQATSLGGVPVPVTFAAPVEHGGTLPVTITCSPTSGTLFSAGLTSVSCTATDAAGRTATCGFGITVNAIPQLSVTRFMSFGDSTTEGKLSLIESPPHSYPAHLLAKLTQRYSAQPITLLNEGLGGERVVDSVNRFRAALNADVPEAVLVMHGVNDLNGVGDGRLQAAVDAIEELVKIAKQAGLPIFVATLPPFGPGGKASCPECINPFNDRLRAMIASRGAILVDVNAAWGNRTDLMGADGIHPTEAGYEVIAEAFFEAIQRTLEKAPTTP